MAQARNVPGAASVAAADLAEDVAGMLVDDVSSAAARMRGPDPAGCTGTGPVVSVSAGEGRGAIAAGADGLDLATGLRVRSIERDGYDYDLTTGYLLGGHCFDDRLLAFGGLVFERGSGDLGDGGGTLEHDGRGVTLGLDYAIDDRVAVSAIVGRMWLDYDLARDGGAVTGRFGADRTFAGLSGRYRIDTARTLTTLTAGLRYVTQTNEAYRESGGELVPEVRAESVSAVIGARTALRLDGGTSPFVEADLRREIASSESEAGALDAGGSDRTHARLGVGFARSEPGSELEAGLGANFDGDAYNGLDSYVRWTLRF